MDSKLDFRAAAATLFIALLATYILCIAGDLLFGWTMYQVWMPLLPGFTWPLSAGGFMIGVLWLLLYSIYFPALLVFPYNYLRRRETV